MKKLLRPAALLPAVTGIAAGAVLFAVGYAEDAPGLCLIGLSAAFVLILWGLRNAGVIRRGFLAPILLLSFGAGAILLTTVLLLDGEFGTSPGLSLIGFALGTALIALGAHRLRKVRAPAD